MTLRKRNIDWLPSLFNDFFDSNILEHTGSVNPAINVKETKNSFEVELAAPGMTKKDFDIHIDGDENMVISLEHKEEKEEKNKANEKECKVENPDSHYLRREFYYSKFQQTFLLPENSDKEKISAKIENGILLINIPKKDRKLQESVIHQIEIQ